VRAKNLLVYAGRFFCILLGVRQPIGGR